MTNAELVQREYGGMVGQTVNAVRPMTKAELETFGWATSGMGEIPAVLVMTGDINVVPSCDPEGNSSGYLFVFDGPILPNDLIDVV